MPVCDHTFLHQDGIATAKPKQRRETFNKEQVDTVVFLRLRIVCCSSTDLAQSENAAIVSAAVVSSRHSGSHAML